MPLTFREAFVIALEAHDKTVPQVSAGTGVSVYQLRKLKEGKSRRTNVDDAVKVAAFFGKTLDKFIEDPESKSDIEIAALLSELPPEVRNFLIAGAQAQAAAQDPLLPESPSDDE